MKHNYILLTFLFLSLTALASSPKREFRATWFTTHYAIDWPKSRVSTPGNASQIAQQKKEMTDLLDQLKDGNLNAFCLQVRPTSDAYYTSSYEPWGQYLTGTRGKDPGYDPLQFAVEEGHKRGMEVHAWVNPFRYEVNAGSFGDNDPLRKNHPDWLLTYSNGTFNGTIIDPGIPEARAYVVSVLMEIITKYDIDGILMDDYFYAYGGTTTEDAASVEKYKPATQSVADWRRENVNSVVKSLYDEIQKVKPWVKLGMGPGGIYSMDDSAAAKYGLSLPSGIRGGDPYTVLYCDPLAWVSGGYLDYLAPQVYWATTTTTTDYDVLCQWWGESVKKLCDRRTDGKRTHVYISQASYRFGADELGLEIDDNRKFAPYDAPGSIFYNTSTFLSLEGEKTCQTLATTRFSRPALTPAVTWKAAPTLAAPADLTLSGTTLTWSHASAPRFSVYAFPKGMNHDKALSTGDYLLGMTYSKSFTVTGAANLQNLTLAVCAIDRYGNEYQPAFLNDAAELPIYTILALSEDEAEGSVTGSGEYMQGATATLTAYPNYGYEFTGWQDNNTDNPRTVIVSESATYTASFALKQAEPVREGELTRELVWKKTVAQADFLGKGVQNRSMAYYNGKLYIADGAAYKYHIVNASTGDLEKTVDMPAQYFAWHNLRITPDGAMLLGNSATSADAQSVYLCQPGADKPEVLASLSNPDFGRTDYIYPAGNFSESGYMLALSNVNNKVLYIPFRNGALGESRVITHADLPKGLSAKAIPADATSFFASVSGVPVTRHSLATGEIVDSFTGGASPRTVNVSGLAFFTLAGYQCLLTPADIYGAFETFLINDGLYGAERIFEATAPLGSNKNDTFTIDFAVNIVGNEAYVYLLAPANGIAAYKYIFTPASSAADNVSTPLARVEQTADGIRVLFSGTKLVTVHTLAGQVISSANATGEYSIALAKGAYIVTVDKEVFKIIK